MIRQSDVGARLLARAEERPGHTALVFVAGGEVEEQVWTYRDLHLRARTVAAALQERGAEGERVLLLFPPGLDFVAAFFGCLYAGAVAVPASPPGRRRLERLRGILESARPRFVLGPEGAALPGGEGHGPEWISGEETPLEAGAAWRPRSVDPSSLAFLQYTSGSTRQPKGVAVTHANLAHNEEVIRKAFRQDESSVVVSWLPFYHDMGLIGSILQPLWCGGSCVLLPPTSILHDPLRWLRAVSRYGGTTSGGPNFAYDLCVRRAGEAEREGIDLTSWRVAFNGSEPVRAETQERFAEAFAPQGFRREAFFPCYGLAEATLMVSGDWDRGRTVEVPGRPPLVSCGAVGEGLTVEIVDPEARRPVAPGEVGEVWVSGPSVARGYWREPAETDRAFRAVLAGGGDGRFLRTGDLGMLVDGHLYLAGRLKDLIIVRGRNHYPQDLELTAERSHPAVRPHAVAAFPVEVEGEEGVALVAEVERSCGGREAEVAAAVARAVALEHQLQVVHLALVSRAAIPRTTSGKIRRRACRDLLLAGALPVLHRERRSPGEPAPALVPPPSREELAALDPDGRRERLELWLRELLRVMLGLEAGGADPVALDSLAAVSLQGRIETALGVTLPLESLFSAPSAGEIARATAQGLDGAADGAGEGPRAAGPVEEHPASEGQRALWYLHRLAPESPAYHLVTAVRLPAAVTTGRLRAALRGLGSRHEALTAVLAEAGDRLLVRPHGRELSVLEVDGSGLGPERLAGEVRRAATRPFDLEAGPLLRAAVFTGPPGEQPILLLTCHHAVADFTSLVVLGRELGAVLQGGPAAPGAGGGEPLRYSDYVAWQERWLAGPGGEAAWRHWCGALEGMPELDLPTDRPRPQVRAMRGAAARGWLSRPATRRVRELAAATGSTLSMVVLAALQVLLFRLSGQRDFGVGFVVSGRPPGLEGVVGYFANPLVLRARLEPAELAAALLATVRGRLLAALEHRAYPFVRLAERLRPDRDPSRSPLFQVLLNFVAPEPGAEALAAFALEEPAARAFLESLPVENVPVENGAAQFDLSLTVAEADGRLGASLRFSTELFDATTGRRWLEGLLRVLEGLSDGPERAVGALELLSPAERHQALVEWGAGPPPDAADGAGLFQLFAARAGERPDAVAVVAGARSLSYGELRDRALALAGRLVEAEVEAEAPVGVYLDRTPDLLVALLGVLASGGAYVPLDPAYPARRIDYIVADSGARIVVTAPEHAGRFAGGPVRAVPVERAVPSRPGAPFEPPTPHPEQLAYLIYTSGSTGRPKGVGIRHGAAVARCRWAARAFTGAEAAAVLAATSVCFDLSVFELFATLGRGGTVVLARDALALAELPDRHRVTLVNTVPSALSALLAADALPPSVRTVNLAGEPLPRRLVAPILDGASGRRLLNLYGPSEDTTYSTGRAISRDEGAAPGIGRPLPGTVARVVDGSGAPAPIGVPGELVLGGVGLSRGYFGRPGLTAERFVPAPGSRRPGARAFRTGDLVRWRADGDLEFLGRRDHQVKIRGFRVELGEIEAVLEAHPDVAEAVAVATGGPGDDARLQAFVGLRDGGSTDPAALRAYLGDHLPAAMVPSRVVALAALPRNRSGKVDRAALPVSDAPPRDAAAPPATPLEELLAELWGEVLGVRDVGRDEGFFDLGGHSLLGLRLIARVRERLGVAVPLVALLRSPTVAGLAREVEERRRRGPADEAPLVPLEPSERSRLSPAQERLWFLHRLEPGSAAYHLPMAVRLRGALSASALLGAAAALAARHDSLRARYPERAGRPVRELTGTPVTTAWIDLADLRPQDREGELGRLLASAAARPFDLHAGPLHRSVVARLGAEEHLWLTVFHHIAVDGWSLDRMLREVAELYAAGREGRSAVLPPLPLGYGDVAAWQQAEWRRRSSAGTEPGLDFWRRRLEDLPSLRLPSVRRSAPAGSRRGAVHRLELPADQAARLRAAAAARGTSLFTALLACYRWLLWRFAGQDDLGIGVAVANRDRPELQDVVGLLANPVVLRTAVPEEGGFGDLLGLEHRRALEAWVWSDVPFERVVELLAPRRDPERHPLFQAAFALERLDPPALPGLDVELEAVHSGAAKFDLSLLLWERAGGGVVGDLEYRADLLGASSARRIAGYFSRLVAAAAEDPDARLSRVPLLSPGERHQVVVEWGAGPAAPETRDERVDRQVVEWARRAPDAVAVAVAERGAALTYGALLERADQVARRLRARGAGPGTLVAVGLERTPEMVVALLGVLRAGAAYLPLDLHWPAGRLESVLREARPKALVHRGAAPWAPPEVAALDLATPGPEPVPEGAARHEPGEDDLAYVIYTSGSSGRPKGIGIAHRGLTDLVAWERRSFGLSRASLATQISSPAFDASVLEIWFCLASGACLVLLDEEARWSPAHLIESLAAARITHTWVPTPLLDAALERPWSDGMALRAVTTGGDRLHRRPPAGFPAAVFNLYGPSESTVVATGSRLAAGPGAEPPAIGRPMDGTRAHVVDRGGNETPLGVPGELCLAGPHLARGYLRQPALTAERFRPDPFGAAGGRLYRSGDLARWRPDGELDFLGRLDHQVKLRGFRIELGEIETVLLAHPRVQQAAAVVHEPERGDPRLAVYAVTADGADPGDLREHLRRSLPAYMVPAGITLLPALPMTSNGKVDHRALPEPEPGGDGHVAPRNEIEEELAEIWAEVLEREPVGVESDFFQLGGHSLQAVEVVSRVREAFGVELPLRSLFESPTVAALSVRVVEALAADADADLLAMLLDDPDAAEPAPPRPTEEALP